MDRRQRKTRNAIFNAFTTLLEKKNFNSITVENIICLANVGRATFYSHFETKDYLLKELCEELFSHVFENQYGIESSHNHIFDCNETDTVFLHILKHLQQNDNNITRLLSSQNNELFLRYFKENLNKLAEKEITVFKNIDIIGKIPKDFIINHISSTFVETVLWWINNGLKEDCFVIYNYFITLLK